MKRRLLSLAFGILCLAASLSVCVVNFGCGPAPVTGRAIPGPSASLPPSSVPSPTITNLNPDNGELAGGASVVITGTNFVNVTSINFGATAAQTYVVNSSTQITVTSPAAITSGPVFVKVTTATGTNGDGAANTFTYNPPQ